MPDPVFSIRLPQELRRRLDQVAAEGDRTTAAEARRAIKQWLSEKISDPGGLTDTDEEKTGVIDIQSPSLVDEGVS